MSDRDVYSVLSDVEFTLPDHQVLIITFLDDDTAERFREWLDSDGLDAWWRWYEQNV